MLGSNSVSTIRCIIEGWKESKGHKTSERLVYVSKIVYYCVGVMLYGQSIIGG